MAQRDDFQYLNFGVLIRNERLTAVHVANGLVQLLRLVDPDEEPTSQVTATHPAGFEREASDALDACFGPAGWKLGEAAHALSIVKTKEGPFPLASDGALPGENTLKPSEYARRAAVVAAGRDHVTALLKAQRGAFSAAHHAAIAGVLNADGRVAISAASSPTTSGATFAGYDTNYTLSLMHAATFLGLLARTARGREALRRLSRVVHAQGPHGRFVKLLGLQQLPIASPPRLSFPSPDGARWSEQAEHAAALVDHLLQWVRADEVGAGHGQTLMSLVDLVGVFFATCILRWTPEGASPNGGVWGPKLIVVSPLQRDARDAGAVAAAQRSLMTATARLMNGVPVDADHLTPHGEDDHWWPARSAIGLGAATGWLVPRDGRGGAKRYFSPGSRQLTTLVRALVKPGEDIAWAELHDRAERRLGLWLGGHRDEQAAALNASTNHLTLGRVGEINQEHLIALGLARQESDNVVRVHGGSQ